MSYSHESPLAEEMGSPAVSSVRPVTATVFGILNIALAVLGLAGTLLGVVLIAVMAAGGLPELQEQQALTHPVMAVFTNVNLVISGLLNVLLVISGIGLLKFKPWGRTLANYCAIVTLVLLAISTGIIGVYAVLPAIEMLNSGGSTSPEEVVAIAGAFAGVIGNCLGVIYPVLSLVFLNRRGFRERILAAR